MESLDDWALPVTLIDPDGTRYETITGSTTRLAGQVLHSYVDFNPDTGEDLVVNQPVVTLRMASLARIPRNGEVWFVLIPTEPDPEAPLRNYIISPTKAMKLNESLGIIKMYLTNATQG